ncbi:MAG: ABC transporter permease [Verrucomicrobiota bacterium]
MRPLLHFLRRVRAIFRREKIERDMAEEMRFHLSQSTADHIDEGLSPDEARYAALRRFGGIEQVKESCREDRVRGWLWLEQLSQDVRHAVRSFRRNPIFTLTIVVTLAIGIGANATIFSVVNAVLLEPLPYADIKRLVNLRETRLLAGGTGQRVPVPVSPATYFDWRNAITSFEQIAAAAPSEFTWMGGTEPEEIPGAAITANLLPMLGVTPLLGRNIRPEENQPGAGQVALLSHAFWQRRFGGDPAVLDRQITLNGRPCTIVGVLPEWFDGAAAAGIVRRTRPDVWAPLTLVEAGAPRSVPAYDVHARLKPGATLATAQSEVDAVMARLAKEFPATNSSREGRIEPLVDRVVGEARPSLWVLAAAVGLVLLIACANVANLLLARATLRGAETAMRAALGASRSRLVRQFLTESLLLSLAGCAVGLGATMISIDAFAALLPSSFPRTEYIAVDGRVLAFTVIVSLLTGIVFGLLPAWHAATPDLEATIKSGGRSGTGTTASGRVRHALVVLQVALSLVLLVGAGLLLQSFIALSGVDPGFDPRNVLTLRVSLMGENYREPAQQRAFFESLGREATALPGVDSAATVFPLPFSGPIMNVPFKIPGRPEDPALELAAETNIVSPEYFHTLGIRVTQGRAFTDRDRADTPPVVIINETLARRIWPGESPLGKRIAIGRGRPPEREVVGVFADIKQRQLDSEPLLQACVPSAQSPLRTMYLAVRGRVAADTLLSLVRQRVAALDANLPVADIALWADRMAQSIAPRRVTLWLLGAFATTALLLAVVGLYGVMSYLVAQRTREFGIRMALGATIRDVLQLVVGHGMKLVLAGLVLGVIGSLALTQALAGFLYGVQPTDPGTFAAVSALLAAVGALACYLPGRRATKVDPMLALRAE